MTEELLNIIRVESQKEINDMDKYNEYADRRNELAILEEVKCRLGLSYTRDMYLPRKTEEEIILSIYKKYANRINLEDTNGIYVYVGTYRPSDFTDEEIMEWAPIEVLTDYNDPRATNRRYYNLEGIWCEEIRIDECDEFERNHTVLYVDDFDNLQNEFIVTAVNKSQEHAVNKVLKKYNKR